MKKLALLGLLSILLMAVAGVSAQGLSAGELEAVADVATAFEAFTSLDSYVATIEQTVDQTMEIAMGQTSQSMSNLVEQTGEMKVVRTETGYNIEGSIVQNINSGMAGAGQELGMTLGLIIVDDVLYARVDDASPMLATMAPEGWVNVNEDGAQYPLFATLSPETLSQLYGLVYPMDEVSVVSITKLDADEIDGQAMRVFTIEYSTEALADSAIMSTIASSLASTAPGVDIEEMVAQIVAGSTLNIQVWLGEDDGLLHRLQTEMVTETELSIQGMSIPMNQISTGVINFSGFNEPLEIVAPEVGA
ncbi:MAG: hypothetical protein K8L97_33130 [Anaerolineae bacterium]|nr:hypothetical protein [Anaerolineae bacterium]